MRKTPMLQRKLQHLAFTVAVSAIATAGLTLAGTKPVLAEFQIEEAGIEKGEVEIEYRGAYHWGVPNENANDLVQSHRRFFGDVHPEEPGRKSRRYRLADRVEGRQDHDDYDERHQPARAAH